MTELQLRAKVVSGITAYNGTTQYSAKHEQLIKIFNDSGLCPRYKMTTGDAWCALTASDAFIIANLAGTGKGKIFPCVECSCSAMIAKAKDAGIWVENDGYIPKAGDCILYDWDDSGQGDNHGDPDHVGIVVNVNNDVIKVFEGNMGYGYCGYRDIPVNGRYIRGFIAPKYKSIASNKIKTKRACPLYVHSYKDPVGSSIKSVSVAKGTSVKLLKDNGNGWSKVQYKEKKYYTLNTNLDVKDLSALDVITLRAKKKGRQVKNGKLAKIATTLKVGTRVRVICTMLSGDYKGYSYISVKGKRYYVKGL